MSVFTVFLRGVHVGRELTIYVYIYTYWDEAAHIEQSNLLCHKYSGGPLYMYIETDCTVPCVAAGSPGCHSTYRLLLVCRLLGRKEGPDTRLLMKGLALKGRIYFGFCTFHDNEVSGPLWFANPRFASMRAEHTPEMRSEHEPTVTVSKCRRPRWDPGTRGETLDRGRCWFMGTLAGLSRYTWAIPDYTWAIPVHGTGIPWWGSSE